MSIETGGACAKPIAELCARKEGHLGECQCPHLALAEELRAGFEALAMEVRRHKDFHLQKAFRVAQRLLQKTAITPADFERELAERRARQERKRAEQEVHPFDQAKLLVNLKAALPDLEKLLAEVSSHWGYEDPVYRFYHQSFKVYRLQDTTRSIVDALQAIAPGRELNDDFLRIVRSGTGRAFQESDNARWPEVTRPMVEAFFHARHFLEMAVRYGHELEGPVQMLPSGWASVLYLYDLR
jgi:hypothetical protein